MIRALLFALAVLGAAPAQGFDPVVPGKPLEFPRDFGAHPGHRIEWWYVTGLLDDAGQPLGFQVTFFRVANPAAGGGTGRFSPRQLLFAHAALADPRRGSLLHAQRSARALEGLVDAATGDTAVRIDDWSLVREAGAYHTRIPAADFTLELTLKPTRAVMLQGEGGFSRKGPEPRHASYYYSEPHLQASGTLVDGARSRAVTGTAWLDHEWSSEALAPGAIGWDWLGVNLEGGGALMAFRMRGKDGAVLWTQGSSPGPVAFTPVRQWKSPRTGVSYPVAMQLQADGTTWQVEPIMDDQELDARASTGTLYWEGAVRVRAADGRRGTGYLELTGYGGRPPF